MSEWISLYTAFLFSLTHTALLVRFLPAKSSLRRPHALLLFAAGVALQTLVRRFDTRASFGAYAYMAALYAAMVLFAKLWSRERLLPAAQRTLCFCLVTECATLAISYFSQRLLGKDLFRSEPLTVQTAVTLLHFLFEAALLTVLSRALPSEPFADRNSLWLSFLSSIPYLFVSQITLWLPLTNQQLSAIVPLMLSSSCLLALMLIASLEGRLSAERDKRQALAGQHMQRLQQQQFEMMKSSAEAVRRNYHDMKNLLLYLEKADSRDDLRDHLTHILEEIRPYETVLDTGSEVLDILLGEKTAVCQREGIACTVMADGSALQFIKPLDLVTIMGNAMDNAIEACRQLPENAARYIQVRTAHKQDFLLLQVRNSCTGEANMEGERFVTTKADSENHGFGLKNIRQAAHNYGGEISCQMEAQEFTLTLIFPDPAAH